ncbi:uncharacterized protein LOC112685506 [Sipha flava]|uniref:Uncharacterized protein LOC112685506 n=1 Tax=Sipha flava TaxID=143950 RepID=A0A8B8FRV6_9HEMI|nr:uncharacterized protein LOC112685506 [Sipha flava]
MTRRLLAVCALALLILVAGCSSRPQDKPLTKDDGAAKPQDNAAAPAAMPATNSRMSRLQKQPSQALSTGFDEIVVESNLQVHNRVGSKNKSKIMLPSNSTSASAPMTNKSARSLVL